MLHETLGFGALTSPKTLSLELQFYQTQVLFKQWK